MRISLTALALALAGLLFLTLRGGAEPLQELPPAHGVSNSPVVAELFTSQSCSSCPPAERLFAQLAERDDLIVLEWHVDYWDRLVHGRAGAWKDPYSDPDNTARQRQYNRALRQSGGGYTPQAVINGRHETIGNRSAEIHDLLGEKRHSTASIEITRTSSDLQIEIGAFETEFGGSAEITHLTLLPEQSTSVPRGENRGVILFSRNIVLKAETIGTYSGRKTSVSVPRPDLDEGCAIIVQERRRGRLGPILAASYCT